MSEGLPFGWASISLGGLGAWRGGGTPSKRVAAYWENGTVHWVSPKDMKRHLIDSAQDQITEQAVAESATSLVPEMSVLMVTRSGILEHSFPVAVNTVSVALNQDLKAVTPHGGIGALYTSYFLKARAQDILRKCSKDGTTVSSIDTDALRGYEVALAPIAEQERIVSRIDELFSRIDEGERALARVEKLVERYRQSVLKAAVTGELTRDWRAARKAAGEPLESGQALLERILVARREAWEAAERAKLHAKGKPPTNGAWKKKYKPPQPPDTTDLPDLPKGWVWASPVQLESAVSHALTIGPFGSDLKVSDYRASGVPLIFVRNIRSGTFDGLDTKFVSSAKAKALCSHTAREGDLLITKMGDPPGDAYVYPLGAPDAIITADCIKWTLHPFIKSSAFACVFINSQLGRRQIRKITTGVAQQKVSLTRFRKIGVCVPGLVEQKKINEIVSGVFEQCTRLNESVADEMHRAAALRQSILKAAFAGQLVPQDPNDEPASALLERIAAERATAAPAKARRGRKRGTSGSALQSD